MHVVTGFPLLKAKGRDNAKCEVAVLGSRINKNSRPLRRTHCFTRAVSSYRALNLEDPCSLIRKFLVQYNNIYMHKYQTLFVQFPLFLTVQMNDITNKYHLNYGDVELAYINGILLPVLK